MACRLARRAGRALRSVGYRAYYAAAAWNHRYELYAPTKRVGDVSFRSYEPLLRHGGDELLRRLLRGLAPGDTVVDVGANTGVYALAAAAAEPTATIVAVEPDPRVYRQLRTNVRRNGFGDRVRTLRCGLGVERGRRRFYRSSYDELGSFRAENAAAWEARVSDVVDVPVRTLDGLVSAGGVPPPDHLKVDVEGLGYEVLCGARETLRDHRPVVYFEPHPAGPRPRRRDEIGLLLADAGYEIRVRDDAWVCNPRG